MTPHVHERPDAEVAGRGSGHLHAHRHSVTLHRVSNLRAVPRRLTEFDDVSRAPRERSHEVTESIDVDPPPWRQLIEDRTEMAPQTSKPREQPLERLLGILQLLHMRQEPARLHREFKTSRHAAGPREKRPALRQPIKAVIDLDRVETCRVVRQPARRRHIHRIQLAAPVPVLPARASNAGTRPTRGTPSSFSALAARAPIGRKAEARDEERRPQG